MLYFFSFISTRNQFSSLCSISDHRRPKEVSLVILHFLFYSEKHWKLSQESSASGDNQSGWSQTKLKLSKRESSSKLIGESKTQYTLNDEEYLMLHNPFW